MVFTIQYGKMSDKLLISTHPTKKINPFTILSRYLYGTPKSTGWSVDPSHVPIHIIHVGNIMICIPFYVL